MVDVVNPAGADRTLLRQQVQDKYTEVALEPEKGFHFHVGRPLAKMLGYEDAEVDLLPSATVDSFAGTGNPQSFGVLLPGERIIDVGCGAGFDTLLAALRVGPEGRVVAVDMTDAMLEKTRAAALELGLDNVDTRQGFAEDLPVESESFDAVISNGVLNLSPISWPCLRNCFACCGLAAGCKSPISSSTRKFPRTPKTTSTSGPAE